MTNKEMGKKFRNINIAEAYEVTIASYNRVAKGYAQMYFQKDIMHSYMDSFLGRITSGRQILDAGCGPGYDTLYMASKGYRVKGIDLAENMIYEAKRISPETPFFVYDIRKDLRTIGHFDGIWCCASLLHLSKKDAVIALRNFFKALKTDGLTFISVKKGKSCEIKEQRMPYGQVQRFFSYYQSNELASLLENIGFSVEEIEVSGRWISCYSRKK